MSESSHNGARITKAEIDRRADEQYEAWMRLSNEQHPFLVCALCSNGGVVTIMAGYAVCWLCRHALAETYHVQPMINIARTRAKELKFPFGPAEWLDSFKTDVRRAVNREKRARKKADAIVPLDAEEQEALHYTEADKSLP